MIQIKCAVNSQSNQSTLYMLFVVGNPCFQHQQPWETKHVIKTPPSSTAVKTGLDETLNKNQH
jgi:hypothetical protein